jgi:hypothetical protein
VGRSRWDSDGPRAREGVPPPIPGETADTPGPALVRQVESADASMPMHEVVATGAEVLCPGNSVAGDGEVKGLPQGL